MARFKDTSILGAAELEKLAGVIEELETKTSGEIRLMIVKRSSQTGHVGILLWALLTGLTALLFWLERDFFIFHADVWFWPSIIIVYYLISIGLARFAAVQRWLTSAGDRDAQVLNRAELEFHREGLTQTDGATGILLFLSLMERQAVVLGDKAIAAKLPQATWDGVIATVLQGARTGRWAEKLEEALRLCGAPLSTHFPIQAGDRNELANAVIVKD